MVFKQRAVQDASKRMYEDARVSLKQDTEAIRNLEWQLGTQETALKRRNDAAARHDAMQLQDFAAATKHSTEGKIKTLEAFKDLIAPGGPAWDLLEHQVEKNKQKSQDYHYDKEKKKINAAGGFGAEKIHGQQTEARQAIAEIDPELIKTLDLEESGSKESTWTAEDERNKDAVDYVRGAQKVQTTGAVLTASAASNDIVTQTELTSGLFGAFGGRVGAAQGIALARAESFHNGYLGWSKGDTIPRTFTYKGKEYEYKTSELTEDYLSQETPIPYLNSVDAYANQILMDARKAGLSNDYMQRYITPIVNRKAGELKATYRKEWAAAKNGQWVKEVHNSVAHDFKTAIGTNDPQAVAAFITTLPQSLRQLQEYNGRLKIKNPKVQSMKDLLSTLRSAGAANIELTEDKSTGLEHLKDAKIHVSQVPWVSKNKADPDGMVKMSVAFPKEWSDEKIDKMNADALKEYVQIQEEIRGSKAKIDAKAVEQCYLTEGHGSAGCKEQEHKWHQTYSRDYQDLSKKLKDKSTLMRDTKTTFKFLKDQETINGFITDQDLMFSNTEGINLYKEQLPADKSWESIYEPVAIDKQVPEDDVKDYYGQVDSIFIGKDGVLGTSDVTARESILTEQVLKITKEEIIPQNMRDIAQEYRKQNESVPVPKELMRLAVEKLRLEVEADNQDGRPSDGRFTVNPDRVSGLSNFFSKYSRTAPSIGLEKNKDLAIVDTYRKKQADLNLINESVMSKPNLLNKNIDPEQFELNNKGDIDVLWYKLAADKTLNPPGPNHLTAEEIRQLHAEVQENPVNAAPKINWQTSYDDLDKRITGGVKAIQVQNAKKCARQIVEASGGLVPWGTDAEGAQTALAFFPKEDMDVTLATQEFREKIIPSAIEYVKTNNTKAKPAQVVAGLWLGVDLNLPDWHKQPTVRELCHAFRTGGLK